MFLIIVVFEIMTPIKIAICLLCILFLFSETAFGICLGCIVYHKTQKNSPLYCPGNVCEIKTKDKIQQFSTLQIVILILFFTSLFFLSKSIIEYETRAEKNINLKSMKCKTGKCGKGK